MIISTLHRHFILRQIIRSKRQATVFVMCVALSIVSLIALNGFSTSVHTSLLKDARALHAADIIIRSNYDLSPAITDRVEQLEQDGTVASARVYEFYSVVRTEKNRDSVLAKLKVVDKGYPFYGQIVLQSDKKFKDVLTPGRIIVSQTLLDRLQLKVGDQLHVGQALLTIEDIIMQEPDQPVNFFFLGPRIFISTDDLDRLDLVKKGSRVRYACLLKVTDEKQINPIVQELNAVADRDFVYINTFRSAESGVKRFFDNFLFFLSLIGIFTLLLAGIGIQSTLTAFLKEKEKTIAILKTVGATSKFFTRHFILILSLLGLMGTMLGILLGFVLQHVLHVLFKELLPPNVELVISLAAVIEGLCLGVLVVGLFSFLPLHRLKDIKPTTIFRKESIRSKISLPYVMTTSVIFLSFIGMVLWQLREVKTGVYFIVGVTMLILISAIASEMLLFLLKKLKLKPLVIRQALRGLFRPRNATKPIIITLTTSLTVIFSIYLIEQNLDATYIQSYPPDAPNFFFIDIQPSQLKKFSQALGQKAEYYPIVRAKIAAINGKKINRQSQRQRRGDNLARTFNLTYRNHLLKDEVIIKGKNLYREDWHDLQVSVLDKVMEIKKMAIGDRIRFKIQGIPLEARISSIRTRTRESIQPYFYFVFPEKALQDAPQTVFTAVRVEKHRRSELQTELVKKFPNVSAIDVTETLSIFARVLEKLSLIIRFFTLFSIIAGILIIISSILATRFARIQEAVYYKILGAKAVFVLKVFTLENLFLGMVSAGLALLLSQIGSWIICSAILEIAYTPFLLNCFFLILAPVILIVTIGLLPSSSILRQKPVLFLREQTQE
jgi:putative ABC transport system permease protein